MTIYRDPMSFEGHYTQVPNLWLRDPRLSRRARGLMAELFSHQAGWQITIESLVETGPEGRDAIRAAVLELEANGYLRRERQKNGTKFAGVIWHLSNPFESELSRVGFSYVGNSYVGESATKKTKPLEDKLLEDHEEPRAKARGQRATAFPASFSVDERMERWARETTPNAVISKETAAFEDWHRAKGSTFKDWNAAWRTWMRRANDRNDVRPFGAPAVKPRIEQPAFIDPNTWRD